MDPSALDIGAIFAAEHTLLIYRETAAPGGVEPFLLIDASDRIHAFNGHVDLGTGIRTSLTQIVAEELDVGFDRVTMILGDTARTPDQGATIASSTIQISAVPLRAAAAQARRLLLARAAEHFGVPLERLIVDDGIIRDPTSNLAVSYGKLLRGHRDRILLDLETPVKPVTDYRLVGKAVARIDIPAKATGELIFVHDMRLPGMLHGRVVRPPYAGVDWGDFVGKSLIAVDKSSVSHIPGIVAIVTQGDFVGVVAMREEAAMAAAAALRVDWKPTPVAADLGDLATALRDNPGQPRRLADDGDAGAAIAASGAALPRTYVWPYQMHGSIGPSCAVAEWRDDRLRVWSGTQNSHPLRHDLSRLLDIDQSHIEVVRMEAAGCYGRNCADDVTADAALLARAVGAPVRVQLSREQEHLWEPKGAAQLMDVNGALDSDGNILAYDFQTRYPSNGAPTLALLLTGKAPSKPETWEMGDRTAIPPYSFPNRRVTIHDMPPIVRASWLRGVSALPNSFAHESWIDEAAAMAGVDPVDYRLRHLRDPRGVAIIEATARQADWQPHLSPRPPVGSGEILRGRGFAYALYVHSKFPGYGAAWAAWVADVAVNRRTGEVIVEKVTVGQDAGLMINPEGVRRQIHGNVIQSTSRVLKEEVTFEQGHVAALEWGAYPVITFPEIPEIDVLMLDRPDQPPRGAGESASVPSAAAIANALYDATGIRFREPPFTPEKIRAALAAADLLIAAPATPSRPPAPSPPRRTLWGIAATAAAGIVALMSNPVIWPAAIAPVTQVDTSIYSSETIERGRQLAAVGDCAICHTAPGGAHNAGGRAIETPFGTIYSTNITSDRETGIGAWSYTAFERAMREGIHRDGRRLYPVFPYPSFAKTTDADLQALYGYLISQSPLRSITPNNRLAFPFSIRALMVGWNALFLRPGVYQAEASRSPAWNRGAYLVEGLGHCAECHSPRNMLGAVEKGDAHLAGGFVDGWQAPALTAANASPVPWREEDFYTYLRSGRSPLHAMAAGPMAGIVAELKSLPDQDIRAMATYLASFGNADVSEADQRRLAAEVEAQARRVVPTAASRIYDGACASCHQSASLFAGARAPASSLALSSNIHGPRADNLVRMILRGHGDVTIGEGETMPAFADSMTDRTIAQLVNDIRARFAPDKPAWGDVLGTIKRLRAEGAAPSTH